MKKRHVTIPSGQRFVVPVNIQRIDHRATHGWQVRYSGTKLFSDGAAGSPRKALQAAKAELVTRVQKYPAPVKLNHAPQANKTNDMPLGLSGPQLRRRPGSKILEANLLVLMPRFGQKPRRATIYLGNENTFTAQRLEAAVKRGLAMRRAAEAQYRRDATAARRRAN